MAVRGFNSATIIMNFPNIYWLIKLSQIIARREDLQIISISFQIEFNNSTKLISLIYEVREQKWTK